MKTAINLRTPEEFDKCMKILEKKRILKFKSPKWKNYKINTCITIDEGIFGMDELDICKEQGYEIITYQQFLERELEIEEKKEPENVIDKFAERLKEELILDMDTLGRVKIVSREAIIFDIIDKIAEEIKRRSRKNEKRNKI